MLGVKASMRYEGGVTLADFLYRRDAARDYVLKGAGLIADGGHVLEILTGCGAGK